MPRPDEGHPDGVSMAANPKTGYKDDRRTALSASELAALSGKTVGENGIVSAILMKPHSASI